MGKKRIVKQIDFTGEDAHIALVEMGANGQSVLLMKNNTESKEEQESKEVELEKKAEVKITTSMQNFLRTFFGMWDDEARVLTELLGYEPQNWQTEVIGDDTTVELLRDAVEDPSNNLVGKETYDNLKKARIEFNKLKKAYDAEKETNMEENVDLQKSIEDAVEAALKKEKEKFAELEKSIQAKDAELVELKKAAEMKEREEMTELCKGYSFVEDAEVLSESLFLCKGIKGFDVILDTLEKARIAIKESLEKEIGTDEEADLVKETAASINISKTEELLKARYAKESK